MRVALTGVPGTGKSSVGGILAERGWRVEGVNSMAERCGLVAEGEVDLDVLARQLPIEGDEPLIIEGHFSHLLPVDIAIVLRCHPEVLRERLKRKGWPDDKVAHNVEAEAVDFVTLEALDEGITTFEVDTTQKSPIEVANDIERIVQGDGVKFLPGKVDWSEVILSWY